MNSYSQPIDGGIWSYGVVFREETEVSKGEIPDSIVCVKQNDPFQRMAIMALHKYTAF